ncbi:hypothetical protein [Polaribacter sp. IC066]|uniref:hypothetical protein n=1 Tax=Polaribacter sp. IC066 TaxID=57032 RepID=UPI0011BF9EC4|nr:hypothetical protein [Polaribacter sp. IC066]TXD53216.1 hypothetical protein ES043_05095 [Polaribacter sp. IC063]
MIESNCVFDFIGTQSDEAFYPTFTKRTFDIDHEGRSGWTSGEILNIITNSLNQTGTPDIVLYSAPVGNDALQNLPYEQAILNIKAIVTALKMQIRT